MGVPGTQTQLLIMLLFVLPGSVYQTVRTRLRGPIPSDNDAAGKILRALTVSTLLNAAYLTVFGDRVLAPLQARTLNQLDDAVNLHQAGLWAVTYLVAVPAALALFLFWASRWEWPKDLVKKVPTRARQRWKWARPAYHPVPSTWDYAFTDIEPCYVRIQTADGKWFGGWLGENSMASSFPETPAVFVERPWFMDEKGGFSKQQPQVRGTWIRCDDARLIEFVDQTDSQTGTEREGESRPANEGNSDG